MQKTRKWHQLGQRFESIPDPRGEMRADGTYLVGSGQPWEWRIANAPSISIKRRFEAIAKLAGKLLSPGSRDPSGVWLETLRKNKINFSSRLSGTEINDDGTERRTMFGTISRLCEASADLCRQLEAESASDDATTEHLNSGVASKDSLSRETKGGEEIPTTNSALPRSRFKRGASADLAARIDDYITHYKISFGEFARLCQTTDVTIRHFRKTGLVRLDILRRIELVLGSDPQDL